MRNLQIDMKLSQFQHDILAFTWAQLLEMTILLAMIEEYQSEVEAGHLSHLYLVRLWQSVRRFCGNTSENTLG